MKKENGMYTYNGISLSMTTWVDLENVILSEINQSQKDEACVIPLI